MRLRLYDFSEIARRRWFPAAEGHRLGPWQLINTYVCRNAVVATSEKALYANIILKKGVL